MGYRPICDVWILARPKRVNGSSYYGAYPAGFLERARALLGVSIEDPVLHVCAGMVRHYPYKGGFGPNDRTLDLDPDLEPDYCQDARDPFPYRMLTSVSMRGEPIPWPAVLMDPPYSPEDARHYRAAADAYPSPGKLVRNALDVVREGGRIGILHTKIPRPPAGTRLVAVIGVMVGYDNVLRAFTVFEKPFAPQSERRRGC